MATKEDLLKIGREGFEAIDRVFGRNRATVTHQKQRYPHHGTEDVPPETIQYPYSVYQRTEISWVPNSPVYPLPGPLQFRTNQYKVPRLVGEKNLVPTTPFQELYGYRTAGRGPAADEEALDNYYAGQLYGRVTRADYSQF